MGLKGTGIIEGKRNKGKQQEKMLDGLARWLNVGRVTQTKMESRCVEHCDSPSHRARYLIDDHGQI